MLELPNDPATPLLGVYPEKALIQQDTFSPVFTAALSTTARAWSPHSCPSADERKEDTVHIYSGALLGHEKEQNWVFCRDVNMLPFKNKL